MSLLKFDDIINDLFRKSFQAAWINFKGVKIDSEKSNFACLNEWRYVNLQNTLIFLEYVDF